ncbi:hypothetical protein SISNIDRAFT_209421 [Sistotremastrum niveocremeum HHB9708]|uniref:Uncharacterized protein n=1 Tax=Sistotremastrum niveocremeum HHB9708 TaxID=1314777 RepID=A0A164QZE8_9AGAM|nr:hypothetical protein SISNIDRAFT_209421 [Sistotremastrum niveocremeum HHB9708]
MPLHEQPGFIDGLPPNLRADVFNNLSEAERRLLLANSPAERILIARELRDQQRHARQQERRRDQEIQERARIARQEADPFLATLRNRSFRSMRRRTHRRTSNIIRTRTITTASLMVVVVVAVVVVVGDVVVVAAIEYISLLLSKISLLVLLFYVASRLLDAGGGV